VTNEELFARAQAVTPGGVNSPVRAWAGVGGGTPYFVTRGAGSRVWDADGRSFIDYVQSYGASILGHAHPAVVEAIQRAASAGSTFGAPTPGEVRLAELLCHRVPGVEKVRLVSSGTEASMSAVRVARGATGRSKLIKFAGCYHGHADMLLAEGGSGVANQGLTGSAGVPDAAVSDTIVAPYNVVPAIDSAVAVVVVEPVACNMGLVPPAPGFLAGLREACDRAGALLLFDEVITGSRLGAGGASEHFGVRPDLWCFGKVIGGGLPIGAFGGRADVMDHLAPLGPVYQAGTLSGNPLATAAGVAVLERLTADAYETLCTRAARLAAGFEGPVGDAVRDAGWRVWAPRVGPLVGLFLGDADGGPSPSDYDTVKAVAGNGRYAALFRALVERGVALAPGPYEILFPSLAHTEADIDQTIELATAAARQVSQRAPSASQSGGRAAVPAG
jgi:glutamate-1-semialdehyde 2,1-aminomutase